MSFYLLHSKRDKFNIVFVVLGSTTQLQHESINPLILVVSLEIRPRGSFVLRRTSGNHHSLYTWFQISRGYGALDETTLTPQFLGRQQFFAYEELRRLEIAEGVCQSQLVASRQLSEDLVSDIVIDTHDESFYNQQRLCSLSKKSLFHYNIHGESEGNEGNYYDKNKGNAVED